MARFFKRFVTANVGLKLLALGLALLVYGGVYLDSDHEYELTTPLVVSGLPDDRTPLEEIGEVARVKVVSDGRLRLKLHATSAERRHIYMLVHVPADARNVETPLTTADVVVPLGLRLRVIEVIDPTSVAFTIDDKVRRVVPVRPRAVGEPPQGYVLGGDLVVEPAEIEIRGARTLVDLVKSVPTLPVDLTERKSPFEIETSIVVDRRLDAKPRTVRLTGDIERTAQVRLEDVPVIIRNRRRLPALVEPDAGAVTLAGPQSQVDQLRRLTDSGAQTGLTIVVDAEGLEPGTHRLSPVVELTGQLRLVSVDPAEFSLRLGPDAAPDGRER